MVATSLHACNVIDIDGITTSFTNKYIIYLQQHINTRHRGKD